MLLQKLREQLADAIFKNKYLEKRVAAFESGEAYQQLKKQHQKELSFLDRKIKKLQKLLGEARREIKSVREKWIQTCDDVIRECEQKLTAMEKQIKKAEQRMLEAFRQRDEALDQLREEKVKKYQALAELEKEKEKNTALRTHLKKDYTNSSKPSSMSPNHKVIPNSREKTGRKPGGQPGHPHHPRKKMEPTQTIQVETPEKYLDQFKYHPTGKKIRKQLINIQVNVEAIEYVADEYRDLEKRKNTHPPFPAGIVDDVNYDTSVKALAYLLNNVCNISIGNVRKCINEITMNKIKISYGEINNLVREFSKKTEKERHEIFMKIFFADIMHADFSFARKNGKQATVMITAAEDVVLYQAREKKGNEGVKDTPLEHYEGTLVSDHEAALISHGSRRQECLAHVLRYTIGCIESEKNLKWNYMMRDWIKRAIGHWRSYSQNDLSWAEKAEELIAEFKSILLQAKTDYEYEPPSKYYMDGFNLYKRMVEEPEAYILFLRDPTVPPTNNRDERHARQYKRKAHQMMTFRGKISDRHYCDGLSITESMKLQGENLYDGLQRRFAIPTS